MANRLASATSPYLLQHRDNPVDWWEWSDEAFEEARRLDLPILLSVGYAACHWCHVMAHESFEDERVAEFLLGRFVAIKVDREERPDVDAVYMSATQALTGHGGWPMTVFLTPDGEPFYAGTYFPPQPRHGLPSFGQLITSIHRSWTEQRGEVDGAAGRITQALRETRLDLGTPDPLDPDTVRAALDRAVDTLASQYDAVRGGIGAAPKFPPSMLLEGLLRSYARTGDPRALTMVEGTCEAMARGGLYDQLDGGFARYSVDAEWVVPHFEKMLYDNALLLRVYAHWWRATGSPLAQRVAHETAGFLLSRLRTAEGAFASALDSDTSGVEGLTYVWTPEQLAEVLGEVDGSWAAKLLEVTGSGTFEHGTSVLQLLADPDDAERWSDVRSRLLLARDTRPQPARDDKVVTAWNGLAIAALAEAGALLDEQSYVDAALLAADFVLAVHVDADGRLLRVSRDGVAGAHAGVLEDHGDLAEGLLALHQVTGDLRWLDAAGVLLGSALDRFRDSAGGFYDTAADAEALVVRPQDPTDNATPSGWTATAQALLTYAALTGSERHRTAAEESLGLLVRLVGSHARFAGWAQAALEAWLDGPREIAVVGDVAAAGTQALRAVALRSTAPGSVLAVGPVGEAHPLLAGRPLVGGAPAAYVCRHFTCDAPVTEPSDLARAVAARTP